MNVTTEQISLAKGYEVRHWMHELHCTETELYDAVRAVGIGLTALRSFRATCPASAAPCFVRDPYGLH